MLTHFFFFSPPPQWGWTHTIQMVSIWTWCASCTKHLVYAFFSFFSSLRAVTAWYLKLDCDHMLVGAACTEEPVFNFSSKLKGEILQFYMHHNSVFTSENIIALLCFMQCITSSFSLLIQVAVPSNCLGREKNKNIHVSLKKTNSQLEGKAEEQKLSNSTSKVLFSFSPSPMLYKAERYYAIFRGVSASLGFLCSRVVSGVVWGSFSCLSRTSICHCAVTEAMAEFGLVQTQIWSGPPLSAPVHHQPPLCWCLGQKSGSAWQWQSEMPNADRYSL